MSDQFNQPLSGNDMPRFGGTATMMRLPQQDTSHGLDACFVGVPFDLGTSMRSGARFGPRDIRANSVLIRPYLMATRARPFESLQVADIGDVAVNPFNLEKSIAIIEQAYDEILSHACIPLTLGGDHTIALPILRAIKRKHGPVGMVHVDAHADINDTMFGERKASRTAHPSGALSKRGFLMATVWRRSVFVLRATAPTISTGPGNRVCVWCRRRSAGTSRWFR
jgi:guanidinobutyrase